MPWFVMIPPDYQSKPDAEKELVDFRVDYPAGSQAYADALAGKVIRGSEGDQGNPQVSEDLIRWKGPFNTEAEAKAAQNPRQQSPNPANDAANALENSDALSGIAGSLVAFYHAVTDGKLWRSLGWVLLGIALMLAGVLWWIGPGAARRSPFEVAAQAGRRLAT